MQTQYNPWPRPFPEPPAAHFRNRGVECLVHFHSERLDGAYVDVFHARDEVAAVVGNVDAAGIAGAVLTAGVQSSLRCMVRQGVNLRDAVEEIDRILWELAPAAVLGTLFSARVHPVDRRLRYLNAGHHPAFIVRADRTVQFLEPNAAPLALTRGAKFQEIAIRFDPGDVFVCSTDDIEGREIEHIARAVDVADAASRASARAVVTMRYRITAEEPAPQPVRTPAPVLRAAA